MRIGFLIDKDGVLIDNRKLHYFWWKRLFEKFGIKLDANEFYKNLLGANTDYIINYVSKKYNVKITIEDINKVFEEMKALGEIEHKINLVRGARTFINYLIENKIPFAIVTSNSERWAIMELKEAFNLEKIPLIVCKETIEKFNKKPKPSIEHTELALELLEKKFGKLDKVFVLEDADVNLKELIKLKEKYSNKIEIVAINNPTVEIEGILKFKDLKEFLNYLKEKGYLT